MSPPSPVVVLQAERLMDERLRLLSEEHPRDPYVDSTGGQVVFHVCPLEAKRSSQPDLRDERRMRRVRPFGMKEPVHDFWALSEGGCIIQNLLYTQHAALFSDGLIEFHMSRMLYVPKAAGESRQCLPIRSIEQALHTALEDCVELEKDGYLSMPILLRLSVIGAREAQLWDEVHDLRVPSLPLLKDNLILPTLTLRNWISVSHLPSFMVTRLRSAWAQ